MIALRIATPVVCTIALMLAGCAAPQGAVNAWTTSEAARDACHARLDAGEFKTQFDMVDRCLNPQVMAAYEAEGYADLDLILQINAKRLELAEKVDAGKITQGEAAVTLAKLATEMTNLALQRHHGAVPSDPAVPPTPLPSALSGSRADAIINGNPQVQYALGLVFAEGSAGDAPDPRQALRWWRSAAKLCGKKSACKILPPVDLSCRDGQQMTVFFSKNRGVAYLFLPHNRIERLIDTRVASGSEYMGRRHVFRQHHGQITVDTSMTTTTCREAPVIKKHET